VSFGGFPLYFFYPYQPYLVGRAGLTFARLASVRFASEGVGDIGQSGTFAPVNRKLPMPPAYHQWLEGFPPMCANEREGKSHARA